MEKKSEKIIRYSEQWYQRSWRPMMAFIYMLLCVLDYCVRPMINYIAHKKTYDLPEIVHTIKDLDSVVQIKVLEVSKEDVIKPILPEFVHLAFGAILGVAAFSRGYRKSFYEGSIEIEENQNDEGKNYKIPRKGFISQRSDEEL
ncbi:MAG: hypothetical protein QXF12_01950 [Candidatus Aenigmatarchaeota archaeon]